MGSLPRPDYVLSGEDGRHDLEVAIALRESPRRGGVRVDLPITDRSQKIIVY